MGWASGGQAVETARLPARLEPAAPPAPPLVHPAQRLLPGPWGQLSTLFHLTVSSHCLSLCAIARMVMLGGVKDETQDTIWT